MGIKPNREQMTNFLRNIKAKGWTAKEVGERWGIKPRQMSNISRNPKVRDFDAVEGLPDKNEVKT